MTVVVHVAGSGNRTPEVVRCCIADEAREHAPGLTGIDRRSPGAGAWPVIPGCSYNHIVKAVIVQIPRSGNRVTEIVICPAAGEDPKKSPGLTGVDITLACIVASHVVVGRPDYHIIIAIMVHIPDSGNRTAKPVAGRLAGEGPVQKTELASIDICSPVVSTSSIIPR